MEKFTIGLVLGAMLGAAVVANSQKTRQLFIKSQEELKNRIDDMIEEKLEMLDELSDDEEEEEEPTAKPRRSGLLKSKKSS